jgi:thiamine-phosphate pyrophosphorylase
MSAPSTRLFLVTPPITDGPSFVPQLEAALSAGDVACVWLRASDGNAADVAHGLRCLVAASQIHGAAALVDDHLRLAADLESDGVHVSGSGDALARALLDLRPSRIVGAGGLMLRDDAMTAGEQEVDYVMFGETIADEAPQPFEERLERVAWWAEIFQVPCVAYAHSAEEVRILAAHGAEFVALGDLVWKDQRGPAAAIRDAEAAMIEGAAAFAAEQAR